MALLFDGCIKSIQVVFLVRQQYRDYIINL